MVTGASGADEVAVEDEHEDDDEDEHEDEGGVRRGRRAWRHE